MSTDWQRHHHLDIVILQNRGERHCRIIHGFFAASALHWQVLFHWPELSRWPSSLHGARKHGKHIWWELYTRRLCKDIKNKKNAETASKELQIWWRVNSIITQDTWYIPFWSHFSLELPQNQATIISRELSADRLDAQPRPRLGANLEKSLHLLCVLWTTPPLLTPSSLDQIWTWKTWELKNNLLICETSAIQDNSTTKFSPLRTSMNKATQKTPKSSQMLVGMSKATIRTLDALCHPQSLLGQGMGDCLYLTAGNLALSWGSVFQGPISVLSNVVLGLIKSTYIRTSVPIHSDGQMPVGITVILRLWVSKPR